MRYLSIAILIICSSCIKCILCLRLPRVNPGFDNRRYCGSKKLRPLAAVLPGDAVVNGVIFQGITNAFGLYSNVILLRIALSWFPQLPRTFTFLKPVFTVTEPYLRFFRKLIPPIAGFDISAIPAILILDILSQATAALGVSYPDIGSISQAMP